MNIADLHEDDRNLKLLAGDSFFVHNFTIKPITLEEVKDVGYTRYNQFLGVLTFKVEDLVDRAKTELKDGVTAFDIILFSGNAELIDLLLDAICFFLKESKEAIKFHPSLGLVFGDVDVDLDKAKVMNAAIFENLVVAIKYQNYLLSGSAAKEFNPKNDKAKSIIDKIKRANELISKKKSNSDSEAKVDFPDLVSAVSTKSNSYNKHNVWTLTMYQFYDEYKRLEAITSYETNVMAMVQGAKVDLKHWCAKLD